MSSNGSEEGKEKQEVTPTLEEVQAQLNQVQEKLGSSETELNLLREDRQKLQGKLEQFEDRLLEGLQTREGGEGTADKSDESELEDISDEGKALVALIEKKMDTLRDEIAIKAERVRDDAARDTDTRADVRQIKKDNPEIFDLVSPLAQRLAGTHPDWDPQRLWDEAKKQFKPLLDAKEAQDKLAANSEEKVSGGPPSGPTGFDPELSEREAFDKACDEAGLE